MRKSRSMYDNQKTIHNIKYFLKDELEKNKDKQIAIINIGTDKNLGDSLAPMVGTLLKQYNTNYKIYGDLANPIHARNIESRLPEIMEIHKNDFIIGIDACLGDSDNIGEIHIRDYPISPGKGVGKDLPKVGDVSIIGIINDADIGIYGGGNIRLNFIYEMAKSITKTLLEVDNEINKELEVAFAI